MKKDSSLTQEDFDALLGWLSADRDEAGVLYEKIRDGLIRLFRFRGCDDAPTLADETINRVAAKISTLDESKNVKTITYFYGFALNVLLEHSRNVKKQAISVDAENFSNIPVSLADTGAAAEAECLKECLTNLPAEEKDLIIGYYAKDGIEKIEMRKLLAERLNLKMNALHAKVFRLRKTLRSSIEKCLEKKSS